MRGKALAVLVLLVTVAATVAVLAWPGGRAEFSRGHMISGSGPGRPAQVFASADYGLLPYLTIHDDYDQTQGQVRWYEVKPGPASASLVLLAAVWAAAVRLVSVVRAVALRTRRAGAARM